MDAQSDPFFDAKALGAVISEMGRLAVQVGEQLDAFMPDPSGKALAIRYDFATTKSRWLGTFYGEVPVE